MKNHRLKVMAMSALLSTGAVSLSLHAQEVESVIKAGDAKLDQAKASQQRVDKLADQAYDILQDFKTVNKQIEGLKVYNAQLDRQIANQQETMNDLQESIENATVMEAMNAGKAITRSWPSSLHNLERSVSASRPMSEKTLCQCIAMPRGKRGVPMRTPFCVRRKQEPI